MLEDITFQSGFGKLDYYLPWFFHANPCTNIFRAVYKIFNQILFERHFYNPRLKNLVVLKATSTNSKWNSSIIVINAIGNIYKR